MRIQLNTKYVSDFMVFHRNRGSRLLSSQTARGRQRPALSPHSPMPTIPSRDPSPTHSSSWPPGSVSLFRHPGSYPGRCRCAVLLFAYSVSCFT
ncbi:hypothetical protein LZ30DRAFT_743933 [Colletotrichum cereale]|nr:hypothetical protein LZ30DRAFT_743933 [Colletotrichum cereale]